MNEDVFHLGIKALVRNKKGEILLLKVNKETLGGYNGDPYWDIPGGRIQKGDTVEETLIREVEEEIGIKEVTDIKPINMVLSNIRIPLKDGEVGLILSIYECNIDNKQAFTLSEEHAEYGWFAPKKAAKLLAFKYPSEFTKVVSNYL